MLQYIWQNSKEINTVPDVPNKETIHVRKTRNHKLFIMLIPQDPKRETLIFYADEAPTVENRKQAFDNYSSEW